MPPQSSKVLASSALHIISNPLTRALSSLTTLGREPDRIDEIFREADLPILHIPDFRFSPIFVMNLLIAKELISMGWKERHRQGHGYWNASIYKLPE